MNHYCTQCGTMLQYPYRFCDLCGAKNTEPPVRIQEYGFDHQDKEKVKLKRVKRYLIGSSFKMLLMIVMTLPAAFAGIFFLIGCFSQNDYLLLLYSIFFIVLAIAMITPAIRITIDLVRLWTLLKEDIKSTKDPFADINENDKIINEHEKVLPYPDYVVYNACIRASLMRFHYPCCGIPYRCICSGWACSVNDGLLAKLYIILTPSPNGTVVKLRFVYPFLDSSKTKQDKNPWSKLEDLMYADGFIRLIMQCI